MANWTTATLYRRLLESVAVEREVDSDTPAAARAAVVAMSGKELIELLETAIIREAASW